MEQFVREIVFNPAWDKRSSDPKKDYGIHGVEMRWYLKGSKGIVQFVVFTNWMLPHVQEELDRKRMDADFPHLMCRPMAADLGYHSYKPMYDGQTPMKCDLLGGECYYDGSGLNAQELFNKLLREGGEAVWKEMEEFYHSTFNEENLNA